MFSMAAPCLLGGWLLPEQSLALPLALLGTVLNYTLKVVALRARRSRVPRLGVGPPVG